MEFSRFKFYSSIIVKVLVVSVCALIAILTVSRHLESRDQPSIPLVDSMPVSESNSAVQPDQSMSTLNPFLEGFVDSIDPRRVLRSADAAETAALKRQLENQVAMETVPELVRNLLYDTYHIGDPLLDAQAGRLDDYLYALTDHPRVRRLVEIAGAGNAQQRAAILENIQDMCRVYLTEIPLTGEPDVPWQPSVRFPGGAESYPYILTLVDHDATTLATLARMYMRLQEAYKQEHPAVTDGWFSSKLGMTFAYACAHFLDTYAERPDLKAQISAQKMEILDAYLLHRSSRGDAWNLDFEQIQVMRFAIDFTTLGNNGVPRK